MLNKTKYLLNINPEYFSAEPPYLILIRVWVVLNFFFIFVFGNLALGSKSATYVDALRSIALAYDMENMAGEDGIEW